MTDQWAEAKLDREYEERRRAALATNCSCGGCLRNGWDFCPRSAAEEEAAQQKRRADDLYERRLPCREAEVAQKRYEEAEANAEFYERRAVEAERDSDKQYRLRAQVEVDRNELQERVDDLLATDGWRGWRTTKMTDLRTYLADKLKADGYDGLCDSYSSCGCGLDDLAPCGACPLECQPAYRVPCTQSDSCCDFCEGECPTDFYTTKKPEGR